jgi:large subunit ribosomal protein L18
MAINKNDRKRAHRRALRVRANIKNGTNQMPRLSVFRSLKHIYAQMIDDVTGTTLVSSSSLVIDGVGNKTSVAQTVGKDLAQKARAQGIEKAFFDRGSFKYTGRISALADAVRDGGIQL